MPRNRDRDDAYYHGKIPKNMSGKRTRSSNKSPISNWRSIVDKVLNRIVLAELQREEDEMVQRLKNGPKFPSWMHPKGSSACM